MTDEISGIANELQIQHFKFSGLSFSDTMFNLLVEAWEEVCQEEFASTLQPLKKETKQKLLSFPFRQKQLGEMFTHITRYCVTEVFAIPKHVTLPAFQKMQVGCAMIMHGKSKFTNELDKNFKLNLNSIHKHRIELTQNNEKIDELRECIKILREMEKVQEVLIRSKQNIAPQVPVTSSPV